MDIVLYHPEIAPNTGNIMRIAANTGLRLHLIRPLGFSLDESRLRRAGLDYREWADVTEHDSLDDFVAGRSGRVVAFTRNATTRHSEVKFRGDDLLLFGPESTGLPDKVLARPDLAEQVRIPMMERSRSLNLSNSVAVAVYEALRQMDYPGLV